MSNRPYHRSGTAIMLLGLVFLAAVGLVIGLGRVDDYPITGIVVLAIVCLGAGSALRSHTTEG